MGRKGVFGLSFQTAFGILAALFIGVGMFAMAPALLGQLSDYANQLAGTVNRTVGQYEQTAKDSARGVQVALSCTAIMNAQNQKSSDQYLSYLRDEWRNWEGGVCEEANSENGAAVGDKETVRVECEDPGFGSADFGGSCEVFNFELPNDFREVEGIEDVALNYLMANGGPKYALYYNAFPDYGVEEDWESKLTGQWGVMTGQFLFRVGFAATIGTLTEGVDVVLPKEGDTFLSTIRGYIDDIISAPKARINKVLGALGDWLPFTRTTAEIQEEIYGQMMRESMEGVSSTAVVQGVDDGAARTLLQNDEAFDVLKREVVAGIQEDGAQKLGSEVAEGGISGVTTETYDDVARRIGEVAQDNGVDLGDDGVEAVFRRFLSEMGDEGFDGVVRSLDEGLDLARQADIPDKYYYEAVSEAQSSSSNFFRAADAGEDGTVRELFNGEMDNFQQMKNVLSSDDVASRVDNMKSIACGGGIYRRMVSGHAALDVAESMNLLEDERIKNSALVARCASATSSGDFCGASSVTGVDQTAACVAATLASQEGVKQAASEIKKEPVGINSLGLKRVGLEEPIEYELHPVANWYFTSLGPAGSDDTVNRITGEGKRFYLVSPCRIDSGEEDSEASLKVSHTQESCYKAPGDKGIKMAESDFAWGEYSDMDDEEIKEEFGHLHGMGQDSVASDVFLLGMQGSYFYDDDGGNVVSNFLSDIFGDESDIVYTENPFVWNKPYEWRDVTDDGIEKDTPPGYAKIIDAGQDIGRESSCEMYESEDEIPDDVDMEEVEYDSQYTGNYFHCSDDKEGWFSLTAVGQPSNPDAPSYNGWSQEEVRERIKQVHENVQVLDDMKEQQYLRVLDKENVYDGQINSQYGYKDTEFMNTVWDTARTISEPGECSDTEPRTEIYTCEEGYPSSEGTRGSSLLPEVCRDNGDILDPEPVKEKFVGGEIIGWEDYCRKYAGNMSELRDMYMGEDGERIYYSQLGYWLPADQTLNKYIENIKDLVDKKEEQLGKTQNQSRVVDSYFQTQVTTSFVDNLKQFFGAQLASDDFDEVYMYGDPEWAWNNVVLEDRENLLQGEDYFRDVCDGLRQDIISEGSGSMKWKYPVCKHGSYGENELEIGSPGYCGVDDIHDEIETKFRDEHDIEGDLSILYPNFKFEKHFRIECDESLWFREGGQGCYYVYNGEGLSEGLSRQEIRFTEYNDKDGDGYYSSDEDDLIKEYEVSAVKYLEDILGSDVSVIGDIYEMRPFLGGETIKFDDYCTDYLSNLTEIERTGAGYSFNEDTTVELEGGETVVPSIPERYMTASGNGKKICQQQSVAADVKEAVNPYDSKVSQEVDALRVKVSENTDLGNDNYCYSSISVQEIGAKGVIMVSAAFAEKAAWGAAVASGGIGAPMAGVAQLGISFLENYLWMRISQESQWPNHGFKAMDSLEEDGVVITDFTDAVYKLMTIVF